MQILYTPDAVKHQETLSEAREPGEPSQARHYTLIRLENTDTPTSFILRETSDLLSHAHSFIEY